MKDMTKCTLLMLLVIALGGWPVAAYTARNDSSASNPDQKTKQSPAFPESLEEIIKKTWTDIYMSRFKKEDRSCQFDYGPNGMRNIYCYLSSLISYEKALALSGQQPFVQGPHTDGKLNLDSDHSFGHYNKDFVLWMTDNLIPGAEDENIRWMTEPVYDKYFRKTARTYYLTYQIVFSNTELLEKEVLDYKERVRAGTVNCWGFDQFNQSFPDDYIDKYLDGDFYYGNVVGCAFGFWLRRQIDGTHQEFRLGLEKLLKTYDAGFLDMAAKTSAVARAKRPVAERVQLEIDDIALIRFLDEFTRSIEQHDWAIALTFFAPENYQAQRKIGIGLAQYLAEGMGFGLPSNRLEPRPGDRTDFAALNSIENIELDFIEVSEPLGSFVVRGRVTLFDGTTRNVELFIEKMENRGYSIAPAVG